MGKFGCECGLISECDILPYRLVTTTNRSAAQHKPPGELTARFIIRADCYIFPTQFSTILIKYQIFAIAQNTICSRYSIAPYYSKGAPATSALRTHTEHKVHFARSIRRTSSRVAPTDHITGAILGRSDCWQSHKNVCTRNSLRASSKQSTNNWRRRSLKAQQKKSTRKRIASNYGTQF